MEETKHKGVYSEERRGRKSFFTRNLIPGKKVYDERLVREGGIEYREWNPKKSKIGAALMKGLHKLPILPGSNVLYLGCASGTTVSHISDIIANNGLVVGIDFAPRVMRDFVFLSEVRKNIIPILGDCKKPETYALRIFEKHDVLVQDIAQKEQVNIFLKNLQFLKQGGYALLAIKARSIDVAASPKKIFSDVKRELEKHITIEEYMTLDPYELDHCFFLLKKSDD